MLTIDRLSVFYGKIQALRDVSLSVEEGEIVALIGANGAGKTTLLRTISGLVSSTAGTIRFEGSDITALAPHKTVALGISQAPEGRRIFTSLSVGENLKLGAYLRNDTSEIEADLEKIYTLFPRLKERLKQRSGTLSGGELQMLAIGRALMARPKLLLLDEPSLGLAPLLVRSIFEVIRSINRQGVSILLVEQNAHMALKTAHRAYVLETGHIGLSGQATELLDHEGVRAAYLGG